MAGAIAHRVDSAVAAGAGFNLGEEELRTLALSVVPIAVAFVVATKELNLCLTGSILKTGARSFNIGERIQIKDFRGDVIDQNLLATTILEIGLNNSFPKCCSSPPELPSPWGY